MVGGLPDDRWALVFKVHHCMVDGVSGADLMTTLLEAHPDAARPEPDTWVPAHEPTDLILVAESLGRLFVSWPARARALARWCRRPLGRPPRSARRSTDCGRSVAT